MYNPTKNNISFKESDGKLYIPFSKKCDAKVESKSSLDELLPILDTDLVFANISQKFDNQSGEYQLGIYTLSPKTLDVMQDSSEFNSMMNVLKSIYK